MWLRAAPVASHWECRHSQSGSHRAAKSGHRKSARPFSRRGDKAAARAELPQRNERGHRTCFRRRLHLFLLLDSGFMEIRLLGEIAHNKGRQMFTLPTTAPQTVRQSHYTQSLGTISVVTLRSECGQQPKVLRFSLPLHFLRCKTNWAIDKESIVYIRLRNGIVRGLMNYQQCSWFSLLTSLFLLTRCTLQS